MIIGWLRLVFFTFCLSALLYLLVLIYARSLRREALERQWEQKAAAGERQRQSRQDFVAAGMTEYEGGLRRRLLWVIFILPFALMSAIFFYINWSHY